MIRCCALTAAGTRCEHSAIYCVHDFCWCRQHALPALTESERRAFGIDDEVAA